MLRTAMFLHLTLLNAYHHHMKERCMEKEKAMKTSLYVPAHLFHRLKAVCKTTYRSVNSTVVMLIEREVAEAEKQQLPEKK